MTYLQLVDVTKTFGTKPALDNVTLDVGQGEIVCLLGPSGCGKTTLLRIVAGLETADRGQVLLAGQELSPVPPHRRDFGLMFQDFALFPHKNVFENVVFGLKQGRGGAEKRGSRGAGGPGRRGAEARGREQAQARHGEDGQISPKARRRNRVREMLALVGLEGFEERSVTALSGGEAQRVALARSLAPNPRLLMLDEPLGSLDRALRERLMNELRYILKEVGVTALYVTHDQAEAFAIADRVVVMNAGRIEQSGPPETIYHNPATRFVARFLGLTNLVGGRVLGPDRVGSPWGELRASTGNRQPGQAVTILIRPEAARLYEQPAGRAVSSETANMLRGELTRRSFRGGRYQVQVQPTPGPALTFDLIVVGDLPVSVGETARLSLDPAGLVLLPPPG